MPELRRLELLVELQRRGTLSAVASALSYSTSAISQQLAQLEADVGAELLVPDGRRVKLTPQATILAAHAEAILDRWEQARSDVAAARGQTIGLLRLAAFQTATAALVPPLISWLSAAYPGVEISLSQQEPETAISGVQAREYDLAIAEWYPGQLPQRAAGLHELSLMTDPMNLATPHAGGEKRTLQDCADDLWILEPEGSPAHSWAVALCREAGFEPRVAYQSPDVRVQELFVARGLAVALLPDLMWMESEPLVDIRPLGVEQSRTIYTVVRSGAEHHPVTAAVREGLAAGVHAISGARG
jgi:DNA-binding transcriptional LysR family regulator